VYHHLGSSVTPFGGDYSKIKDRQNREGVNEKEDGIVDDGGWVRCAFGGRVR
jgi:hypothetical protein